VKVLEEIGLPELSLEQKENLCILVEKVTRNFINSKIPSDEVQTLNIGVEIDGSIPVTVTIDLELVPTSSKKDCYAEQLVNEATRRALREADIRLGEIVCKSKI
jgi:hypothetical protein